MSQTEARRAREWTLDLPWPNPPLTLNQRGHWRTKHTAIRQVRYAAATLARQQQIPTLARCQVELWWEPADNRRRDADNLVATLKPLCDGLVDAGIVPDDVPAFMVKAMPEIGSPRRPPRLWLLITELPALGDAS